MLQSRCSPSFNTIFEGVSSYRFTVLYIEIVTNDDWCVKWCSSTDFIIDIVVGMILKFHFFYSQLGYKGKYSYSPTQFSVAIAFGTSV